MRQHFFFHDPPRPGDYTLSLHDALPISEKGEGAFEEALRLIEQPPDAGLFGWWRVAQRSEEHTSELQSRLHLVCRLLLEKRKHVRAPPLCRGRPERRPRAERRAAGLARR